MNGTFLSIAPHLLSRIVATALMAAANLPVATFDAAGQGAEPPLRLEARIPLGDVRGRIDHMAIDTALVRCRTRQQQHGGGRSHPSNRASHNQG
ncbi:hypothetical protein NKI48_35410, partial [Mesorhizobium sp. M0644]